MKVAIRQRGRILQAWPAAGSARRITERMRKQSDERAKWLVDQTWMETGYYDLVLMDGIRDIDSQILIA